jgi:hypothetical protein
MPQSWLLPFREPPFPQEILSSWIVRLCLGLGCELQAFTTQILGTSMFLWNGDVDRQVPESAIVGLSRHTGIEPELVRSLTLQAYAGIIFNSKAQSGPLRWALPVVAYRWQTRRPGIQYCPSCLSDDPVPYFRKFWRLAFYTFCPHHQEFLQEACPKCGATIFPSRRNFSVDPDDVVPLYVCPGCRSDLRRSLDRVDFCPEDLPHRTYGELLLKTEWESFSRSSNLSFFDALYRHTRGYIGYVRRNTPVTKQGRITVQNGTVQERYARILPWISAVSRVPEA